MSKIVQIGSQTFKIPVEGENPPWGEDLTAYFEAVADALADIQGPNDILTTEATLANNQSSAANIPGLLFNNGSLQGVEIDFLIYRIYSSGASTVTEMGKIMGSYNGVSFDISTTSQGDSGVDLIVTSGGQFQYTSSNLTNHVSSTIKFKAKTIDE